jgi:hypothetical protein
VNPTFNGAGLRTSFELPYKLFLFGGYSWQTANAYGDSLDVQAWDAGLGWAWSATENLDLYGKAAYVGGKADYYGFSADDDGYSLALGVRGAIADRFELEGSVTYADLSTGGSDTTFGVGARWFFTQHFALGLEGGFSSDATSWGVGFRWDWGRNPGTTSGTGSSALPAAAAPAAAASSMSLAQMCNLPARVDQAECLGQIKLGMTHDEVIRALGQPTASFSGGEVLRYDERYLHFDSQNRLTRITDHPAP